VMDHLCRLIIDIYLVPLGIRDYEPKHLSRCRAVMHPVRDTGLGSPVNNSGFPFGTAA